MAGQKQIPQAQTGSDPHPAPKKKRTGLIVGISIGAAVVIIAIVIGILWTQHDAEQKALRVPHSVPISIVADGYTDECTKFPIFVTGTDLDGNSVEQTYFVGIDGAGISLVKGAYDLTFPASPLTPDGVLYNPPAVTLSLTIGSDLETGAAVSPDQTESVTYTKSSALDETDAQIQTAYDWAMKDESQQDRATELKDTAASVHAEAVAAEEARAAEEAARKAEEERQRALAEEKQAALASNPSVIEGTAELTGTVRYEYVDQMPGNTANDFSRGWVCYLELPAKVELRGTQYEGVSSSKVILNSDLSSYAGQVVTISASFSARATASIKEAAISPIWANQARIVKVY